MISLIEVFKKSFSFLTRREQRDFYFVVLLGCVNSLAQLVGLAALLPVLRLAFGEQEHQSVEFFGFQAPSYIGINEVLLFASVLVVASAAIQILHSYSLNRYVKRVRTGISVRVLRSFLSKSLTNFYSIPRSKLVRDVDVFGNNISNGVLSTAVVIISRIFLLLLFLAWLLTINPFLTLYVSCFFSFFYILVAFFVKRYIKETSKRVFVEKARLNDIKIDVYDAFREVILAGARASVLSEFKEIKRSVSTGEANITIVSAIPKFILEAVGMLGILLAALYLEGGDWWVENIAVLGFAAYRLIPAMQQMYKSVNQFLSVSAIFSSIEDALQLEADSLHDEVKSLSPTSISLEKVCYSHPGSASALFQNVSLSIPLSGICVVCGESGSGKSTFLDLLMGLVVPDSGSLLIDGVPLKLCRARWFETVSYCASGYGLVGSTVEDIVCLGSNVDSQRLKKALNASGFDKVVDDRGILVSSADVRSIGLSDGEVSRLVISRALYREGKVLFMDEVFSSLDTSSAKAIIARIGSIYPELCIIAVSHRPEEFDDVNFLIKTPLDDF
ncbi:ABC-type bacteriocin/lantibiotic exporters, contain an N-terminal double-glycine peptidase domain [Alteromonadaceae bacterium Bs31]|nr:ABC-type bacteriocin/lantibiotic exporters, contain an N-terminal double-glycine peptidase domain [Alteromonadaceae bacterium Bs31]